MMKPLLLTMLLLSVCVDARAEWVEVGENDDFVLYAEFDSIRKKGNMVKMWDLKDYKSVKYLNATARLSSKTQYEYDCGEVKARMLAFSVHSGQMGSGRVVYTDSSGDEWQPVIPGSSLEISWEIACGEMKRSDFN